MLNVNVVNKNVLTYLREQGNRAEGYCTDQCGRFVLPMDCVTFGHHTDEGPPVLLNGVVRQVFGDEILIEPFGNFGLSLQTHRADACVKHPKNRLLLTQLLLYFSAANSRVLHGRKLHLNGEVLCSTT